MDIKEYTLEQLVNQIIKAQQVIEETKAAMEVLRDEVKERLVKMKLTGTRVNNHYVTRVRKLVTSNVSLTQAKEYGAVKLAIDGEKIKQLVLKGVKIKGVKWIEYLNIREAKNE